MWSSRVSMKERWRERELQSIKCHDRNHHQPQQQPQGAQGFPVPARSPEGASGRSCARKRVATGIKNHMCFSTKPFVPLFSWDAATALGHGSCHRVVLLCLSLSLSPSLPLSQCVTSCVNKLNHFEINTLH